MSLPDSAPADSTPADVAPDDNPLSSPSDLPYGLPPLDRITPQHIVEAIEAGLAAQREEWEAIATDPAEPTVDNTVVALERSGRLLNRALTIHWTQSSSCIDDVVTERDEWLAPQLAAHTDALYLDQRIFQRLDAVHDQRDALDLDAETCRLVERIHTDFVRAGAALDAEDRQWLSDLNRQLSEAGARFKRLLVEGTKANAVHVTEVGELVGMSEDALASAAASAEEQDLEGWLLPLVLPSGQPAMSSLTDRRTRQGLYEASVTRCLGGPQDTRPIVAEIVGLRAERAALLGAPTHAAHVIADQTAGDADTAMETLRGLVGPATANARVEAAELEALLLADGEDGPLQPWDWAYYAERVRSDRYGVEEEALRPYFAFDAVLRDGVFAAATDLYGITFVQRDDLPTYHPDVQLFEVFDHDGDGLGLCLIDPWSRPSKRGGAWMTTLADQSALLGGRPVVTVTHNIPRPAGDGPALMTVDAVRTLFHEFGHALHGLFSDVTYPRFSGTSVPRDFVEFPSQVNEMWAFDPAMLARYARHHETGEALDPAVVERLEAVGTYGEGFATSEYLAAALLDLAWHTIPPGRTLAADDVEAFELDALAELGLDLPWIPPRYRTTYFAHIFAGGYSAGYYSYIWSEVLDAELVQWFGEQGGLRRENGQVFRDRLLARGGAEDPMAAFEAVRGRPPTLAPLLERRGLSS